MKEKGEGNNANPAEILNKIQIQGPLDESDAQIYQQVIKNIEKQPEKRKIKKNEQKQDKPLKISEYFQNFKKKEGKKNQDSAKTLLKRLNDPSKNQETKSVESKFSLRFSNYSGKKFDFAQKLFSVKKQKSNQEDVKKTPSRFQFKRVESQVTMHKPTLQ